MPLYEYTCESCGERFEVLQRIGEGADSVLCPGCGGHQVTRQLSTFAASSSSSSGGSGLSGGGGGGCGSGFG